jgi:hypothetical protein
MLDGFEPGVVDAAAGTLGPRFFAAARSSPGSQGRGSGAAMVRTPGSWLVPAARRPASPGIAAPRSRDKPDSQGVPRHAHPLWRVRPLAYPTRRVASLAVVG